jgi:uncharacterized protein with von Willebrand factor type A (vWA) domain
LATNGLSQALDADKHGLFTQLVLDALKGAADKEGFEPDGLVTVDELWDYLKKEWPERARKYGKMDEEKRPWVLEGWSSHFVLAHNPAATAKVAERLNKLAQLAKDEKISQEGLTEGQDLLQRMPKLKAYQNLRRAYQQLVDGTLSVEDFTKERKDWRPFTKICSA